ncbi:hypothetical protein D3C81_2224000 [compost metagenome]
MIGLRVAAQAAQGRVKAAVAKAVFAIGQCEVALQRVACVGRTALFGEPVHQCLFVAELMQG